jgi:hypothetical protein
LDHLENERGSSTRTRNPRLAAIHSCSATPPWPTPSTPSRSLGSWRSHRSASTGH